MKFDICDYNNCYNLQPVNRHQRFLKWFDDPTYRIIPNGLEEGRIIRIDFGSTLDETNADLIRSIIRLLLEIRQTMVNQMHQ